MNIKRNCRDVTGLHFFLPAKASAAAAAAATASAFNFSSRCSRKTLYSSADRLERRMRKRERERKGRLEMRTEIHPYFLNLTGEILQLSATLTPNPFLFSVP